MGEELKQALKLQPLVTGGFFLEIYRDSETLTNSQAGVEWLVDKRGTSTHIYYLLMGSDVEKFHRMRCDEGFSFYTGNTAVLIHCISPDGTLTTKKLDSKAFEFYVTIPKGSWFAVELADCSPNSYALMGCTVAPAFEYAELEIADRQTLTMLFPQHLNLINKLS